ncbi:uncharacterized protein LOC110244842 [Exaiptasia diaphana]|uniref:Reverse transcriptase domain-containing protein n=1 Tax=Exaiptasia diaphana TaxID=2652724 RepID=A0A913XML0_EXADI|nr:uncharacterized protein LOC110244842 [Exaiptasia diaphana]
MGARTSIIRWVCSFLSLRRQAVKLNGVLSKWAQVHAGVPQGTKLRPILFLIMVNDLAQRSPLKSSHWKYVDDITLSEVVSNNTQSVLQTDLDHITSCAKENSMNLNPKKCKELRISFLAKDPDVDQLMVEETHLERVKSHKVLGVTLCDNLKWNLNIDEIVTKASKRLYILRVLKRAKLPTPHLTSIYCALIRSVMEYACSVWNNAIQLYLVQQLERIQRRAMKIILPGFHYETALSRCSLSTLAERRAMICKNTFNAACDNSSILYGNVPPTRQADVARAVSIIFQEAVEVNKEVTGSPVIELGSNLNSKLIKLAPAVSVGGPLAYTGNLTFCCIPQLGILTSQQGEDICMFLKMVIITLVKKGFDFDSGTQIRVFDKKTPAKLPIPPVITGSPPWAIPDISTTGYYL